MLDLLMISLMQAAPADAFPQDITPPAIVESAPAPARAAPPRRRNEVRCRNQAVLGSRMSHRSCEVRRGDEVARDAARRAAEAMGRDSVGHAFGANRVRPCQDRSCL